MAVTGGSSRDGDQEAGVAFVTFLRSSGLPQSLWETLLEKISTGSLGIDGQVEVRCSSVSGCDGMKVCALKIGNAMERVTGRSRGVPALMLS